MLTAVLWPLSFLLTELSVVIIVVQKFPGGPGVKVFAGVSTILFITGYPIFLKSTGGKQGEHYFSPERPEQITAARERARKEYMEKRKAKKLEEQHQQS